jgi:hypothetical protein
MAIDQKLTADESDVMRAMKNMEKAQTKLIEQQRKMARASAEAGLKSRSGFSQMRRDALGAAKAYIGIQAAIQAVTQALKQKEEQEKRSADHFISLAGVQENAIINLGDVTAKQQSTFFANVKRLAANEGLGQAVALQAASEGLSAAQGDRPGTLAALRSSARLQAANPENIPTLTAGALDIRKMTGSQDADANLGLLLTMQSMARGTTLQQLAEFGVKNAVNVHAYGGTPAESFALISAFSQSMTDPKMRMSGTAAADMAKRLADFLPEQDRYDFKDGRPFVARPGTGLKSTTERMAFLRREENEMLSREYYAKNPASTGANATVLGMIGIEGFSNMPFEQFGTALGAFPTMDEAAALTRRMQAGTRRLPAQQIAAAERARIASTESQQTNISGLRSAADAQYTRKNMDQYLKDIGVGYLDRLGEDIDWWTVRGKRKEHFERTLRNYADRDGYFLPWHTGPIPLDRPGIDPERQEKVEAVEQYLGRAADAQEAVLEQVRARRREAQRTPAAVGAALHQHGE